MIKKITIILIFLFILITFLSSTDAQQEEVLFWEFQSIDTMKYSRDIAREKLKDRSFDFVIDMQVKNIAQTGATHIALATPYDEEFIPYLRRWVDSARRNNLKIWYRGNFSGWEKWFGYSSIDRKTHIQKTKAFIVRHPELFQDGDVFTPCPECENGGPGDPRQTGDVTGHRNFLIEEYKVTIEAFAKIKKHVKSNFASMNGDVARLIMDKDTTKKMDGIVVIDHYVGSAEKLIADIKSIAKQSGGKIVLGEFGAPILDIHGQMNQDGQATWVKTALEKAADTQELTGLSYWVNVGGSTELWDSKGKPRKVVAAIKNIYSPKQIIGIVKNGIGSPIKGAIVSSNNRKYVTGKDGYFFIPSIHNSIAITIEAQGYKSEKTSIHSDQKTTSIVLNKEKEDWLFKAGKTVRQIIPQP